MKKHQYQNDEIFQSYISQVTKIPLLTAEEEVELSKKIQKGNELAKKKMIEANLRLVVKVCCSYSVNDVPFMDLIQEGNMGLMHAATKFDGTKNIRFSTYASLWIRQAVTRYLETKRRAIHIPVQKEGLIKKINFAEQYLRQVLGRSPKISEIAQEIGCDEADIVQIISLDKNIVSLEGEIKSEDGFSLEEIFEDQRQINPEQEYIIRSSGDDTRRFLKRKLDNREHAVIMQRFRFHQSSQHTFKKIGEELGISAEAVRQIEKKALKKISKSRDELANCVYA